MAERGAYGRNLGDRLRVDSAPVLITKALRRARLAVTEIRNDAPDPGISGSIPREDAFLVGLQLRDFPKHEYWEDGRQAPVVSLRAGEMLLYDLKRDPVVLLDKPYHSLHFYLSRAALNAIADDANVPRIGDLNYRPGAGVVDETVRNLGLSMRAALAKPEQVNRMFTDHVALALGAHVAQTYGGMSVDLRPPRGGLAPHHERRVKAIVNANLDGEVSLDSLARECGLSTSHFSRAFRQSTGESPHQWLLQRRVDKSKDLLRNSRLSLSEIALACGFSDQSHFTRVFSRTVGISPGAWRRCLDS